MGGNGCSRVAEPPAALPLLLLLPLLGLLAPSLATALLLAFDVPSAALAAARTSVCRGEARHTEHRLLVCSHVQAATCVTLCAITRSSGNRTDSPLVPGGQTHRSTDDFLCTHGGVATLPWRVTRASSSSIKVAAAAAAGGR